MRAPPLKGIISLFDFLERLDRFAVSFSKWFNWIGGIGLVGMLALVVADIFGIKLFKNPIPGAIEMVAFLGVVITAFAIAYTYILGGHIQVEFFVSRLPRRATLIIGAFTQLLSMALFAVLAWRSFEYAQVLKSTGEVSMTQGIPFYPFVYMIAACCLPAILVLLVRFLKSITEAVKS